MKPNLSILESNGYKKVDTLGSGHFSTVNKMEKNGKIFAVKAILKNKSSDKEYEDQKKSLLREIEIMKAVQGHKNIVGFLENFEDENYHYFVLELLSHGTLEHLLEEQKKECNSPLNESNVIFILSQILEALDYIHEKGIMHRDIKPDNILFNDDNDVKISDFGLSAYYKMSTELQSDIIEKLRGHSTKCGPTDYVSPQVLERKPYDYKTDIYSLGVTLYQMMTLTLPFNVQNEKRTINKQRKELDPNLFSKELIELVTNMLKYNPNERPSAKDALDVLNIIKTRTNSFNLNRDKNKIFPLNNSLHNTNIKSKGPSLLDNSENNSSLFSILLCFSRIDKIIDYFFKNKSCSDIIFKDKNNILFYFMKVMADIANNNMKGLSSSLPLFRSEISARIKDFQSTNEIPPNFVIDSLLMLLGNECQKLGFTINNSLLGFLEKNPNVSKYESVVKVVNDFTNNYKNLFSDLFCYLRIKSINCPKCKTWLFDCKIKNYLWFAPNINASNLYEVLEQICKETSNEKYVCKTCKIPYKYNKKFFSTPKYFIINFDEKFFHNKNFLINDEININNYILLPQTVGYRNYFLHSLISKENSYYIAYISKDVKNKLYDCYAKGKHETFPYDKIIKRGIPCLAVFQGFNK